MNSFRDFEKSLCILWDRACINILDPDQVSGANGILCYGYVDHAAGLTFEGLALVSCIHQQEQARQKRREAER